MVSFGTITAGTSGLILAAAVLISPLPVHGADSCKIKLATTGDLQVAAKNVSSNPRWGTSLTNIGAGFSNEGTCYDAGGLKLTKCLLGTTGTMAAAMPPANCTVCVGDDGPTDCCAFLKGCTPGMRLRDASFQTTDPRIEAAEVPDATTMRFTAVNVQVVDGTGDTDGAPNGRGNVIVGYNENAGIIGSHGLIVGMRHTSDGHAGVAIGYRNFIYYSGATAIGAHNFAMDHGVVSGGTYNAAYNVGSVSAGISGYATGLGSSVTGGYANTASGAYATVSGGSYNTAYGETSSISGGRHNYVYSNAGSITGGKSNQIISSGDYATIAGGRDNTIDDGNFATILGGRDNEIVFSAGGYNTIGGGTNISVGGSGEAAEWHAGQSAGFPTATQY